LEIQLDGKGAGQMPDVAGRCRTLPGVAGRCRALPGVAGRCRALPGGAPKGFTPALE